MLLRIGLKYTDFARPILNFMVISFVFACFACLIKSEDLRQEKRHIKQLSCKGVKRNKRHQDDPFVTDKLFN